MERLIVTGGRLDHRANAAVAVWGYDILRYTEPGLALAVVGDGPERERLERFARSAWCGPDAIRFAAVSPTEFAAAGQVWVTHRSGGKRLALAAMAAGRPVIACDTPELRELVGDAGLYFPPGGCADLARQARWLFDRPGEAAARGEAGRRRAEARFPAWRLADALAAVYHEGGVLPAS